MLLWYRGSRGFGERENQKITHQYIVMLRSRSPNLWKDRRKGYSFPVEILLPSAPVLSFISGMLYPIVKMFLWR